jgi:hypothetical protein
MPHRSRWLSSRRRRALGGGFMRDGTRARGERPADRLERLVASHGVMLLHDRRVPPARTVIEHLAIGPGGVTVIAMAPEEPGERERDLLVEAVARHAALVRTMLERAGVDADVAGALCLPGGETLPRLGHETVGGVAIGVPRQIARLARRQGPLDAAGVARVAALVARAFPPA